LSIPDEQVEEIVVALILDEKIQGRIDQVTGRLELDRQCVSSLSSASILSQLIGSCMHSTALETRRYQTLDSWTSQLVSIQSNMLVKAATAGGGDRMQPGGGGVGGIGPMGDMFGGQRGFATEAY